MPELMRSSLSVGPNRRAIPANCLVGNRSRGFGCANLRASQRSQPGMVMDSKEAEREP